MQHQVKIPEVGQLILKLRGVAEPETAVIIKNQYRLNRSFTRNKKII